MSRKHAGIAFALCLVAAAGAGADSDAVKNCISAWVTSCSRDCATARCVSNCTTQAHAMCTKDITQPQHVFNGPVTSTPLPAAQCTPPDGTLSCQPPPAITIDTTIASVVGSTCSQIAGTVFNSAYFGGNVTIYVICPAGSPTPNSGPSTTIIGQGRSSCVDGSFSFQATNVCGGQQTGCYGLIAATPPSSCEACGTCGDTQPSPGDPGWNTCTSDCCPSP